jgi:predicted nuclease of predicted toxin-antitoxin system
MAARLKVDENLPKETAELLKAHGCDAVTVLDQGWMRGADTDLWQCIQQERRWLVTADKGFSDVRLYPPGTHAGIILLRVDEEGLESYLRLTAAVVEQLALDEISGAIIIISNRGVRIRGTP